MAGWLAGRAMHRSGHPCRPVTSVTGMMSADVQHMQLGQVIGLRYASAYGWLLRSIA